MLSIKSVAGYLVVLVMAFAAGYMSGRGSMMEKYGELSGKIEQAKAEAKARMAALEKQREQAQAEVRRLMRALEDADAKAKAEIARLNDELEHRPVRVRVIPGPGACGGRPEGDGTTDAGNPGGDAGAIPGVLPEVNSRRLRAALIEVEKLSAAYASCRAYVDVISAAVR